MPSKTLKVKSSSKSKTKSVEPVNKCEFLRGEYKLSTLKSACVALNIKVEDGDTADILCKRMQKERPDLMKGKVWNLFNRILYDLDLKKSYKAIILAFLSAFAVSQINANAGALLSVVYSGIITQMRKSDTKTKYTAYFPETEKNLERSMARAALGHDPRTKKLFGRFF